MKAKCTKPHIRLSGGRYHCTGRGISVAGMTADGAFIAWMRQAALMVICRMEVEA